MAKTSKETVEKTPLTSWDWCTILYNKIQTANKQQGKGYDFITKENKPEVMNEIKKAMSDEDIKVMLKAVMIIIKDFYTIRSCVYKVSNPDKAIIQEQQKKIAELEAKLAAKKKTTKKKDTKKATKKTTVKAVKATSK